MLLQSTPLWCKQLSNETHHGIFEKFVFCVILPEQKFAFTSHCGLNLNYELMIFQAPLCGKKNMMLIHSQPTEGMRPTKNRSKTSQCNSITF